MQNIISSGFLSLHRASPQALLSPFPRPQPNPAPLLINHLWLHCIGQDEKSNNDVAFQVDIEGFETEMKAQRKRSKDSAKSVDLEVGGVLAGLASEMEATIFSGYHDLEGQGRVVALLKDGDSVSSCSQGMLTL